MHATQQDTLELLINGNGLEEGLISEQQPTGSNPNYSLAPAKTAGTR